MKIAVLVVRILLGLAFFAGGLNHIINVLKDPLDCVTACITKLVLGRLVELL